MIIHIVKAGETTQSIAKEYQISEQQILMDNGLTRDESLVIGQTIVVVHTDVVYKVKEGDTLSSIAENQGVDVIDLLRNNSFLSERNILYPGEILIISYADPKRGTMVTNGYAFPFINKDTLRKTLPYLTYLSIYEYVVTPTGDLIDIDDKELIAYAKTYGVAPMMVISSIIQSEPPMEDIDYRVLTQPEVADIFIANTLKVLKTKEYYGLNLYIQSFLSELQENVVSFLDKFKKNLNDNGFYFMITITPNTVIDKVYEEVDFKGITAAANGVLMLAYEWGYASGPPAATTPIPLIIEYLDYASMHIPPDMNNIGIPMIAYNWELPYIEGVSVGNALSINNAMDLARDTNSIILFDEVSAAPYFYYSTNLKEESTDYVVWFKDARSIDLFANLVTDYRLQGMAIWNIMSYDAQLWLILNTQYDIERVDISEYTVE